MANGKINKISLLNYTGGENNWGCKATSSGLLKTIQGKYPEAEVFTVPIEYKNVTKWRDRSSRIKVLAFTKLCYNNKLSQKLIDFFMKHISKYKDRYKQIMESDIVILNGEGSIHSYSRAMFEWFFYLWAAKKIYNKKTAVINHTLQFNNDKVRKYCKKSYAVCDAVVVRDPVSKELLDSIGYTNTLLTGDAAFLAEPCSKERVNEILNGFNIQGKFITLAGTVIIKKYPLDKNIELFKKIKDKYNLPLVYTASCDVDKERAKLIKEEIKDMIIMDDSYTFNEVMGVVGQSEIFITGRFHPMIFSMVMGKPFVAYKSNTYKMEGVIKMLNYPVDVVDLEKLSSDEVMEKINYVMENRDELSRNLTKESKKVIDTIKPIYEKEVL